MKTSPLTSVFLFLGIASAVYVFLSSDNGVATSASAIAENQKSLALPENPATRGSSVEATTKETQQRYPAASCGQDMECLKNWFVEYKAVILSELDFWKEFENDVARRNTFAALSGIRAAHTDDRYKHVRFDFFRSPSIKGINRDDLGILVGDCRFAIIDMKYMVAAVASKRELMEGDPGSYLRSVKACERRFRLRPISSDLRRG